MEDPQFGREAEYLLTGDNASPAQGVSDLAIVDGEVGRGLAAVEPDLAITQLAGGT